MRISALALAALALTTLVACGDGSPAADDDAGSPSPSGSSSATTPTAPTNAPNPAGPPLQFRVVRFSDLAPPTAPRLNRKFDQLDCAAEPVPRVPTPPEETIVACTTPAAGGGPAPTKYVLSPARIVGGVVEATAEQPVGSDVWTITIQLDAETAAAFAELSRELVGTQQQFAIILDGRILSAPTVQGVITGGAAQITGDFTEAEAEALAHRLGDS